MAYFSHFKTKNKGILGAVGIISDKIRGEIEWVAIKCEHLSTDNVYLLPKAIYQNFNYTYE